MIASCMNRFEWFVMVLGSGIKFNVQQARQVFRVVF